MERMADDAQTLLTPAQQLKWPGHLALGPHRIALAVGTSAEAQRAPLVGFPMKSNLHRRYRATRDPARMG